MAKRLNLLQRLGQNDYGALFSLAGWQGLPKAQTEKELAYIEENGKLPDSLISRVHPDVLRDLKDLLKRKLPSVSQQVSEKFDEAGAGLGDVEQQLEAFRQAGKEPLPPAPTVSIPVGEVASAISGILRRQVGKVTDELINDVALQSVAHLQAGVDFPTISRVIRERLGNESGEKDNAARAGDMAIQYLATRLPEFNNNPPASVKPDYSSSISHLTDLRNAIQKRDVSRQNVIDFLRSSPEELGQSRAQFISGERTKAQNALREQVIPDIAQSLNVRGGLYSGELGSQISEAALSSQSQIQNLEFELQKQDENFFADAAYQTKLQEEINAGKDVQEQIQAGQTEQRLRQQQRFESSQGEINRQFNLGMQRRQQERQFQINQQTREFQRQQQKKQNEAELIRGLVTAGTQIGTAAIVPKVPSTI